MTVATPIVDAPPVVLFMSPVERLMTPCELSMISMLRECEQVTDQDVDVLTANPALLDEIVVLAMLHQRHDLTDLEYEVEKGEVLGRAR